MTTDATSEQEAREAFDRNPFPDLPWIRIRDDGIAFATGYSEALHRLLRWVPKAEWRARERVWLVPFTGAQAVRAVLPEITRLADAARELDEPTPPAAAPDLRAAFIEAATLLHGADWRAVMAAEHNDDRITDWIEGRSMPALEDPLLADLAARLRRKAVALIKAADRLEPGLAGSSGDSRS
jgi:hypothetical protein